MNQDVYRFRVGDLDCIALRDSEESVPVRELVLDVDDPDVASAFARRGWPTDVISYDFLGLFVEYGDERLVVDPGWGPCTDRPSGRFVENLRHAGISPDDVTWVILTHLDLDHAGGVLDAHGGLAFPRARHVMAEEALVGYTSDRIQAMLPPADAAAYRRMASLLSGRTLLTQGETEILPGVRAIPAPGHRLGHTALEIVSSGQTLLHLADTVLHPIVVEHPDWRTGYDSSQDVIRATRRRLFDHASRSEALVFLSHAPFPGLGHVARDGGGWRWEPLDPSNAG